MLTAIRRNVTWRAIPIAGFAAGSAFLLTNIILTPLLLEIDPALILRYFASLILGENAVMQTDTSVLVVGILVHFALSIFFALVIAIVVHRWGLLVGIVGGALLGLAFYAINLYTMTLFFQWFFAVNNNVLLLSHVIFGAVAGGVYELFDHYDLELMEERN